MLYYLASRNYTHTDAFHMSIATVHTQTKKVSHEIQIMYK